MTFTRRAGLCAARYIAVGLLTIPLLSGCAALKQPIKNLGKSDVDMVGDVHIQALRGHLRALTLALYDRNPGELGKIPGVSLEARLAQILDHPTDVSYRELDYKYSVPAIELAFDRDYDGDRVFALLLGISSMLRLSYNDLDELFLFDHLDPQTLYDSARNLERIARRLRGETRWGKPLIELGPMPGEPADGEPAGGRVAFEDTISRMAGAQDLMAEVIAAKSQRVINTAVHGATTFLIPIGL